MPVSDHITRRVELSNKIRAVVKEPVLVLQLHSMFTAYGYHSYEITAAISYGCNEGFLVLENDDYYVRAI